MPEHPARTWGFRLSAIDVAALLIAPGCAWALSASLGAIAWALPVALGHFFLFCNIFRIQRGKELCWAAVFVAQVATWSARDELSWPLIVALQSPLTLALIAWEMRGPRYHGIAARRLNPRLDRYLAGDPP